MSSMSAKAACRSVMSWASEDACRPVPAPALPLKKFYRSISPVGSEMGQMPTAGLMNSCSINKGPKQDETATSEHIPPATKVWSKGGFPDQSPRKAICGSSSTEGRAMKLKKDKGLSYLGQLSLKAEVGRQGLHTQRSQSLRFPCDL
jgi:hypothetical protein